MEPYFTLLKQEKTEEHTVFHIELNRNHAVYQGHFPSMPVTPGVVLLDISRQLAEIVLGKKLHVVASKTMKFLTVVSPMHTPQLAIKLRCSEVEKSYQAVIVGEHEATIYFKFQLMLSAS